MASMLFLLGELPQRWHGGERLFYECIMRKIAGSNFPHERNVLYVTVTLTC